MKIPLGLRLKVAIKGVASVLKQPLYSLLALIVAFTTLGVILWSLNVELLWFVLVKSPLSLFQKVEFVLEIFNGIMTNYEHLQIFTMLLFSGLFGINTAVLVFVVKRGQKQALKSGSSVGGLTAAIIGGGCIACGTSIITPLVTSLGATATVGLNNTLGMVVNVVGIVLILYSLIGLGQRAATLAAN